MHPEMGLRDEEQPSVEMYQAYRETSEMGDGRLFPWTRVQRRGEQRTFTR